jgi:hypothetical protein
LKNQIIKLFQKPINGTKLDGSNPKLVKAVEDAIGKPTETPKLN